MKFDINICQYVMQNLNYWMLYEVKSMDGEKSFFKMLNLSKDGDFDFFIN